MNDAKIMHCNLLDSHVIIYIVSHNNKDIKNI